MIKIFNLNLIPGTFFKEIENFKHFYIEISGGYHSTYTVLEFFRKGFKNCYLINNRTYLEYKECKENIDNLIYLTGYPINIIYPNLKKYGNMKELMKKSFEIIPFIKGKKNYKSSIPCCKVLKKNPAKSWLRKNLLPNSIVISSLTPYESFQRQMRLFELKKQNTYIRNHKTKGCYVAYPYRDLLHGHRNYTRKILEPIFEAKLIKYGLHAKHSACRICPIRIINPIMLEKDDCSIKYNSIFNLIKN